MIESPTLLSPPATHHGGLEAGEMERRIQSMDWSQTRLGPMEEWSPALRMMVTFLLANRFPQLLWWGPEFVSIYNDAYRPVLGAKHPWALGQPVSVCWQEIWHILQPLIETPFRGGPSTWMEDIELEIRRHGYPEETHFTIAYSPVPDESVPEGIGGVLATLHEITDKVIGERRGQALRDLAMRGVEVKTAEAACANAANALRPHARDVPFALLYLLDADRQLARYASSAGAGLGDPICPDAIRLDDRRSPWPFAAAFQSEEMVVVADLGKKFSHLPPGPWADPPNTAVIVPIPSNLAHHVAGFLVVGVSSRIKFDQKYRDFVQLLTSQIAPAIASARAYAEEARRAAALAELDRAKIAFFSNVSHEFRTPLTLMLGPLEQAIRESTGPRETLEIAHRNSLRLLKLVNSLLDFSRIEAGRVDASYAPVNLAAFTAELVSQFRAAIEQAGLKLVVECAPPSQPAYIDHDMWEKVVFNLLSNALKFTFTGAITVRLREAGAAPNVLRAEPARHCAILQVEDTGTGIPPEELPRIFERFHRVRHARSRSHEGTGIGLALVQELVGLHGGKVEVASEMGRGTVFTVSIPLGSAHLPPDRLCASRALASTGLDATPYVEEAMRWLPDAPEAAALDGSPASHSRFAPDLQPAAAHRKSGARIVLADDNSDMRDYVRRLLTARGYQVATAADGVAALDLVQSFAPALVLTDVMMPRLDGYGLLEALRAAPATKTLPVLLLTARAGEEARIEGATAGADDYLTKPFSARELLARIETHLELARVRRESAALLEQTVAERTARLRETIGDLESFSYSIAHDLRAPLRVLQGFSEVLLEEHADQLNEEGRRLLGRIAAAGSRMDQLVQDVLNYSRVVRSDSPLGEINLKSLLREVVATYPAFASGKATIELDDTFPRVLGNEAMLLQVFSNLLGNAVKFVRPGITPRVRVSTEARNQHVRVSVRDNGIGIHPSQHEKIFEIFQQAEAGFGGTGIGLAIVKKAVERMRGTLGVNSAVGQGSEFWFELPRV